MKKLLLMPILLIFACGSDSDSNNNDDTTQLFLEKYDGVMWGNAENDLNWDGNEFSAWWITFNSTGFTVWETMDGAGPSQGTIICDVYNFPWGDDSEGYISTIQEETEDSLTIISEYWSGGETITWIVSPDGNFIALVEPGEPEPNWDTINGIDDIILGEDIIFFRHDGVTIPPYGC